MGLDRHTANLTCVSEKHVFDVGSTCNYSTVIIYVLFYMLSAKKKLLILTVSTWFLILDKIHDGDQDGDHVQRRHRPPAALPPINYASSCRDDQRLSTEGEIVSTRIETYQKLKGCGEFH